MNENKDNKAGYAVVLLGLAAMACMATGVGGLVGAIAAAERESWTAMGVCLGASAIAFGAVFNGLSR